jgi:hypothetical protein
LPIIAPPLKSAEGKTVPPDAPKGCPKSQTFRIRLKTGASVGFFAQIENIIVEIHDLSNSRGMSFEYIGIGPGAGLGVGSFSEGTDFLAFTTNKPCCLEDFDGAAAHTGVQAAAGVSASFDLLDMMGPFHRLGADPIHLTFPASLTAGKNAGVGMGFSTGDLHPINKGFGI